MGLTDALLLDPYPFEIWIAQGSDGHTGTGTLNDPFDGGSGKFDASARLILLWSLLIIVVLLLGMAFVARFLYALSSLH